MAPDADGSLLHCCLIRLLVFEEEQRYRRLKSEHQKFLGTRCLCCCASFFCFSTSQAGRLETPPHPCPKSIPMLHQLGVSSCCVVPVSAPDFESWPSCFSERVSPVPCHLCSQYWTGRWGAWARTDPPPVDAFVQQSQLFRFLRLLLLIWKS